MITGSVISAPPGACGLAVTTPAHLDDGFLSQAGGLVIGLAEDYLGQARAVADDQERHGLQLPAAMQPAGDHHVLANVPGQVGG